MDILRLVVTGTPGAGKSSFVRSISDVGVVDTDRAATDAISQLKAATTVAFDYGRVTVGSAFQLHVYGTPGQSRFNFMWDILIQRAHAYVLLVAAHRPEDFPQARAIMTYMNARVQIPMVIGITHTDRPNACTCEEVMLRLDYCDRSLSSRQANWDYCDRNRPMATGVDANNQDSVNVALHLSLLSVLLSQRQNATPKPATVRASIPVAEPPLYVPQRMPVSSVDRRYPRW
ncbi:MAG: GTPase [Microcoleus sp. SIO2G3]|nr:GTPase [Microcoleus sp. SIO2G3]